MSTELKHGPSAGALDAESPKNINKKESETLLGRDIGGFFTDLHHILHARSCNYFPWFPHTTKPPRHLKRTKHFNLILEFLQLLLFGITF